MLVVRAKLPLEAMNLFPHATRLSKQKLSYVESQARTHFAAHIPLPGPQDRVF